MLLWDHLIMQLPTPTQWAESSQQLIHYKFMLLGGTVNWKKRFVCVARYGRLFCFHIIEVWSYWTAACWEVPFHWCISRNQVTGYEASSYGRDTKCKQSQLKRNPKQSSCTAGKHPESLLKKSSLACSNSRLGWGGMTYNTLCKPSLH